MIILEKKLPKVFANKVDKNAGNNENVFYSDHDNKVYDKIEDKVNSVGAPKKNINQKINDIFNSPNYIYKADVTIKLKNETITKRIVGRNSTHLITMENELIPISDIVDINIK